MRCRGCAKDVTPTQYGRCPLCGAVVEAGAADRADAKVRRRASWRRFLEPPGDGPGAPPDQGCGGCLAIGVGVPALLVCMGLFAVGQRARWTSDGPGMLFVMLGVAGSALVAFATLGGGLLGWLLGGTRLGRWLAWLFD